MEAVTLKPKFEFGVIASPDQTISRRATARARGAGLREAGAPLAVRARSKKRLQEARPPGRKRKIPATSPGPVKPVHDRRDARAEQRQDRIRRQSVRDLCAVR
jgi:hypothetical protein